MTSSSTTTMTPAQGPTTSLRPNHWGHSASFNHLRPSHLANIRPITAANLVKPHPVKVSANPSRQIQSRLPFPSSGPSDTARLLSRHASHHKSRSTTAIPAAPLLSTVVDTKLTQTLETAFKVFNDRFQKDLRDFQAICTRFVVRETQEKDRWYNLYLQAMTERDQMRQELESQTQSLPSAITAAAPSSSPPPTRPLNKRARDTYDEIQQMTSTMSLAKDTSARPIRNLRTSVSPPPRTSDSTSPTLVISSPNTIGPIPSISHSPFSSPSPPLPPSSATSSNHSSGSSTDGSNPAVTNHMIARFYDFGAAQTGTHHGEDAAPQPKRRKSLDLGEQTRGGASSSSSSSLSGNELPRRSRTHSPRRVIYTVKLRPLEMEQVKKEPCDEADRECLLGGVEFDHVDIMYVRNGDRLVCRACSLSQSKTSSSTGVPSEPTSFSVGTRWDELKQHCVKQHPVECGDVARLHPAEIFELRRRIYGSA